MIILGRNNVIWITVRDHDTLWRSRASNLIERRADLILGIVKQLSDVFLYDGLDMLICRDQSLCFLMLFVDRIARWWRFMLFNDFFIATRARGIWFSNLLLEAEIFILLISTRAHFIPLESTCKASRLPFGVLTTFLLLALLCNCRQRFMWILFRF